MPYQSVTELAKSLKANIGRVIVGKERVIDLLFIALVTSGHVLLEDVPGTGKTMLAKSLAKSLKLQFRRVQFTPDLLPSDLTGIQFYNQKEGGFEFRPGPLFTNLLLADEINRATPRTQASLLECMEERQISVEGETKRLDKPFMVIATQNPVDHQGTFPLPEAQLDRFLFKIEMGYPTTEEAVQILKRFKEGDPLEPLQSIADAEQIAEAQRLYSSVRISDDVLHYLLQIVEKTRAREDVLIGVSPRGSQALLRAVQVYAILQGRDYVTPDDVKAMAAPALAHRLALRGVQRTQRNAEHIIADIIRQTAVPAETGISSR
ncbi:MoxR family ATPase [Paenibacillus sp. NEAU-GSW1]|uniref:AAA family ATPase n=1 Tax=Paenibacillus sp. NEAU-GSW1 TaxID=2682486 RepID=UPI0012E2B596|nr:MoxR family ATPase [Paenibacillus sp. NEAU-GSW1]MUT67376.1 AAA domain-containing protein [Paenibacillus sp. NEAU-GSW1]